MAHWEQGVGFRGDPPPTYSQGLSSGTLGSAALWRNVVETTPTQCGAIGLTTQGLGASLRFRVRVLGLSVGLPRTECVRGVAQEWLGLGRFRLEACQLRKASWRPAVPEMGNWREIIEDEVLTWHVADPCLIPGTATCDLNPPISLPR